MTRNTIDDGLSDNVPTYGGWNVYTVCVLHTPTAQSVRVNVFDTIEVFDLDLFDW